MIAVPTLDEIRSWPATVDLPHAASVFGISRSQSYELAKYGDFPVPVLRLGRKWRVVTADLIRAVGGTE